MVCSVCNAYGPQDGRGWGLYGLDWVVWCGFLAVDCVCVSIRVRVDAMSSNLCAAMGHGHR